MCVDEKIPFPKGHNMRRPSNNTEKKLPELLEQVGLKLPQVIDNLSSKLISDKENYAVVRGIMDTKTRLTERVKLLELELFIEVLKKF